jgi:hypothetical protein
VPLYPYRCPTCGNKDDYILEFDHDDPECCGGKMHLVFSDIHFGFSIDFTPGWDDGAGRYFDTKTARENWVAENNLRRIRS